MNQTVPYSIPNLFPPEWAIGFGEDRQGVFTEIEVGEGILELRWIPAGSFMMGDSDNQHEVILTHGFWLGRTQVTQEQWKAVMGNNPSHFKGDKQNKRNQWPVELISWNDCIEFFRKLNKRLPGLHSGLPTEAQWEYACRAGTTTDFNDGSSLTKPTGSDPALNDLGWYDENSEETTHEAAKKNRNKLGLYDMHGNVWEWCHDCWGEYPDGPVTDPIRPMESDSGYGRVLRGGSWFNTARSCRSAYRNWHVPGSRLVSVGFRLAAGPELKEQDQE